MVVGPTVPEGRSAAACYEAWCIRLTASVERDACFKTLMFLFPVLTVSNCHFAVWPVGQVVSWCARSWCGRYNDLSSNMQRHNHTAHVLITRCTVHGTRDT